MVQHFISGILIAFTHSIALLMVMPAAADLASNTRSTFEIDLSLYFKKLVLSIEYLHVIFAAGDQDVGCQLEDLAAGPEIYTID